MLRLLLRAGIVLMVLCIAVGGEAATTGKTVTDAMSFYDIVEIAVGTYCATGIGPMQKRMDEVERKVVQILKVIAPRLVEQA